VIVYQLSVFVPESHLDQVKQALFDAGAGRIGDYEHCCWQTLGQGQFRPLAGANPAIGEVGEVERVAEYKVELVVADALIGAAVAALRKAHPYETPAFQVWRLADI
jgi:hypothetical protein